MTKKTADSAKDIALSLAMWFSMYKIHIDRSRDKERERVRGKGRREDEEKGGGKRGQRGKEGWIRE